MKTEYIKATRKQLINSLQSSDINRRIDNMSIYREYNYILLDDAKRAAKESYKRANCFITCKVYVTERPGTYGHQFMAAIWIKVDGEWYQASGSITGGCGYDKISTAIDSAIRTIGLDSKHVDYFAGVGNHDQVLAELAGVLAGRKAWFTV